MIGQVLLIVVLLADVVLAVYVQQHFASIAVETRKYFWSIPIEIFAATLAWACLFRAIDIFRALRSDYVKTNVDAEKK